MPQTMPFDFISDVSCPWCIVGLRGLEIALEKLSDAIEPAITFHPFELNPHMPPGGQDIGEHVAEKYGSTPEQRKANGAMIRQRAADVGFDMADRSDGRIYNTFDAHRLLHWAKLEGKQLALKHRLFTAYFTEGRAPEDHDVLIDCAGDAGLDTDKARALLASDRYAADVRAEEERWRREGINSVPTIIIDKRYVISGGQPPEAFERALARIAEEKATAAQIN